MSLSRWQGKVALVTGASSGIGEAIARRLGEIGMRVAVAARRAERLERLAQAIREAGAQAMAVSADLRVEAGIAALFAKVREAWGGVDVLINNAGLGRESTLADGDPKDWKEMLDVNVFAASLCIREALADMEGKVDAQIVNISSLAGHRVPLGRNSTYYAATKHALKALTDGLRFELVQRKSPIKLGMISPGLVETGFHETFYRDADKAREGYSHFQVLQPADIAEAVCYLLSTPPHVQVHDVILRAVGQQH